MPKEKFRPGAMVLDRETKHHYRAMADNHDTSVGRLYGRACEIAAEEVEQELENGEVH